jgi:hypothetical protein
MHFTYPTAKIDEERERNWNKERKRKLGRGKDGGPKWSGFQSTALRSSRSET